MRNKVVVVPGDMHAPGLGLSDADRQRLHAEVDFVVHSAASISFFEHVHTLLEQNYEVGMQLLVSPGYPACTALLGSMHQWRADLSTCMLQHWHDGS